MPEPVASVIVPTRNRQEKLANCIEALLADQGSQSLELIVVDDCSDDGTKELLEHWPTVQVATTAKPSGSSAARNLGLSLTTAPIVVFIDDDIVVKPGLLAGHLDFHRRNQAPELALGGLVTWDPKQPISQHMRWLEDGGPLFAFNQIDDPQSVAPEHFCTANVSVKRALLERVDGPFNAELKRFTDVDLGLRLADAGMKLHFDSALIGWHLRRDTPATTDERMFEVGKAARQLSRLGNSTSAIAEPPVDDLKTRAKAVIARIISPIVPLFPEKAADRVWGSRAAWAYGRGWRSEKP